MNKSKTEPSIRAFQFSETAAEEKPSLEGTPKEFLKKMFDSGTAFGLDNVMNNGFYKVMGWAFDFRPYLKTYVYKQYGSWREVYAPNKTLLRKAVYGKIERVIEI